jgi:CDP-4-dehydro-6-deoxyglucose reductase
MATPIYTIRCTKNERIANAVYDITFTKPDGFTFAPGQFLMFDVPLVSNPSDIQPRAYSIASHPSEPELRLVVRLKPGGRASEWVEKMLTAGMDVVVKGPMGLFHLHADASKDILFVCTGAGIAPFRPMMRQAIELWPDRRIDLLHGVSVHEDLFWQEEMGAIVAAHPHAHVHYALSRPTEEWSGLRGRVQEVLPTIITDIAHRNIYVCGNPDMTKELKALCLQQWGVPKEDFHMEGYV